MARSDFGRETIILASEFRAEDVAVVAAHQESMSRENGGPELAEFAGSVVKVVRDMDTRSVGKILDYTGNGVFL